MAGQRGGWALMTIDLYCGCLTLWELLEGITVLFHFTRKSSEYPRLWALLSAYSDLCR